MRWIAVIFFSMLSTLGFAAERTVGSGQTYATIQAALNAAVTGDTVKIFPGTYTEGGASLTFNNKHSITIYGTARDSVILESCSISVGGTNTFIHSLTMTNWLGDGVDAINIESLDSVTISNVVTGDALTNVWANTRSHMRARNSSRIKYLNNIIRGTPNLPGSGYQTGLHLVSAKSGDGDYSGGSLISGNDVWGLEGDGVSIHGDWITYQLNSVRDCIGTNADNHADGIAFIRSVVDGLTNCNHVRIDRNLFKNTTQNIWIEGWPVGSGNSVGMRDVWITRNVSYMDAGFINGRNMDLMSGKCLAVIGGDGIYVYNNYFGRGGNGNAVLISDSVDRSVLIKGNIIFNTSPNTGTFGIYVETEADVGTGDINYNRYWTTSGNGYLKVGVNNMNTLGAMQAQGFEANGSIGDPLVNALPTPTLQSGSPCIDASFTPGGSPHWTVDLAGVTAPQGAGWDVGAYEFSSGGGGGPPPTGQSRWPYTIFGRFRGLR